MFPKTKSDPLPAAPGFPATGEPARRTPGRAAPSIIAADVTLRGSMVSEGEIQVDGAIEGDVRCGNLTIGETGVVHGDVAGELITVKGRIVGSIRGRKVVLNATAKVEGDIAHASLSIDIGAVFEGHVKYAQDPLAAPAAPQLTPPPQAASTPMNPSPTGTMTNEPAPIEATPSV